MTDVRTVLVSIVECGGQILTHVNRGTVWRFSAVVGSQILTDVIQVRVGGFRCLPISDRRYRGTGRRF